MGVVVRGATNAKAAHMRLHDRAVAGWSAVALSTGLACLWAYWGIVENFHEGWHERSLTADVAVGVAHFVRIPIAIALVAAFSVRWPRLGGVLHAVAAVGALIRYETMAGRVLVALPLGVLAILWFVGRPQPRRLALALVLLLPLLTLIGAGVGPAWRVTHRLDDGRRDARVVVGNGVRLEWAPAGPGWSAGGASWAQALEVCRRLSPDGTMLRDTTVGAWRLPTVEEAVRSLTRHGENAGGVWDSLRGQAHFRVQPDKESPLWDTYSGVIYWWTASEIDSAQAWQVVYNGYVRTVTKTARLGSFGFRAVKVAHTN